MEAERSTNINDTRTVYKTKKELSNKPNNSHVPIKSQEGRTLTTDEDIFVLNQPCSTEELDMEDEMLSFRQ